jgi:hypothetical protein
MSTCNANGGKVRIRSLGKHSVVFGEEHDGIVFGHCGTGTMEVHSIQA